MTSPELQIDEFVKNMHRSNSARAANEKILIPSGAIIRLKSIQFELEDRRKCNSLPNGIQLAAINNQEMMVFRQQRSQALEQEPQRRKVSLPEITVPKFDGKNYDDFVAQFNEVVTRTYGEYGAPIDYLLRETDGAYMSPWTDVSREALQLPFSYWTRIYGRPENTIFPICPIYRNNWPWKQACYKIQNNSK